MSIESAFDIKYKEAFEHACDHVDQLRQSDYKFTISSLEGLLESLYVSDGNNWLGRGELGDVVMQATIAGYEHKLSEWKKENENGRNEK